MRKPSAALIVASIALFVALGGTSYAVTQLPKNSVGTKQIKKSAVTSVKIKDGTVAAGDLAPTLLSSLGLSSTGATGAAGANGSKGEKGDTGATGSAGAQGAAGAQGIPGPTASAFAWTTLDTVLTAGGGYSTVVRLSTAGTTTGSLVLDTAMRVLISADVNISKGTGVATTVGNATCRARWASDGSSFTSLGPSGSVTFPDLPAGTAMWETVPVNAYVDLSAGTSDFALQCFATNAAALGTANLTATEMTLTLTATAQ
jgi:hypothetical protein